MKKRLLLFTFAVVSTVVMTAQTTIYAFRDWQVSNPSDYVAGPAKFMSDNPSAVTLLQDQTDLGRSYAGLYYNYKWYVIGVKPGTQSQVEGIYEIDMKTGDRTFHSNCSAALTEMTYDYTTGTVYAIRSDKKLVTVDLHTGKVAEVASLTASYDGTELGMLGLACDLDGKLYGIATNDFFFEIDKKTGKCKDIGPTMVNAAYTQSMEFDHNTHTLYWINNGDYSLYTVDVSTGKATLVGRMGGSFINENGVETGSDSFCSMAIPYIHVNKGAPDRVTERVAVGNETSVKLTWKYPAVDAQGKELTNITKVHIYRDGKVLTTINITSDKIGTEGNFLDTQVDAGEHRYGIVCENKSGIGGRDDNDINAFVGDNAPGAVKNLKVIIGDNEATIKWNRPTAGMYGGAFDPASVSGYNLYRISGMTKTKINTVTATEYTDRPSAFGNYQYVVTAFNEIGEGTEVRSENIMVKPADWLIMRNATETIKEGVTYKFYDSGGPDGYYKNSETFVLTLVPENNTSIVQVQFKNFSIDYFGDVLSVYNGDDVTKPLIGEFASESLDMAMLDIKGLNEQGALTFKWVSDILSPADGWFAEVKCVELKQNDLMVTSISGDKTPSLAIEVKYDVKIRNYGLSTVNGNNYTIKLIDDLTGTILAKTSGIDLKKLQEGTVEISYIPTIQGQRTIHAEIEFNDDDDLSNNKSDKLDIFVLSANGKSIRIGDNDPSNSVLPASFMSTESLSEQLYLSSEIGIDRGMIHAIAFPMKADKSYVPDVKIWLAETDMTELTKDGMLTSSDMSLVYDGNNPIEIGNDIWMFHLDVPYNYAGKNLVVLFYKSGENTNGDGVIFCGTFNSGNLKRSVFANNYFGGTAMDPSKPIESSPGKQLSDIQLIFDDLNGGVNTVNIINDRVSIYPNPAGDIVKIDCNDDIDKVEIYNISGTLIKTVMNSTVLSVEDLLKGQYIVKIETKNGTYTKLLLKK